MKSFLLFLLIPAVSFAQSITISGGRQSIIVSGQASSVTTVQDADDAAVPVFSEVERKPIKITADGEKTVQNVVPTEKPGRFEFSSEPVVNEKPIVDIYLSTSKCPPCDALKAAVKSGKLYGTRIHWHDGDAPLDEDGNQWYPTVVAGGRTWRGYATTTPFEILSHLGLSSAKKASPKIISVQPSQPMYPAQSYQIRDQWGTYDPRTYSGCNSPNCAMCNTRRAVQRGYRQTSFVPADPATLPADQQPTSPELISEMITLMRLRSDDVLADLGCGDGRILIAAVQSSGCRAVGVELDPQQADRARRNVAAAGLSGQIEIIEGDALDFNPQRYGVTAITAYLFEELLEQLRPIIQQARVAATPFHKVPGLAMTNHGDVWLYRRG